MTLGGQPLTAELRLMMAVLEDGLRTLVHGQISRRSSPRQVGDLRWLVSRRRDNPFAFENVCEALGINASRLRRRVLDVVEQREAAKRPAAASRVA